MIDHVHVKCQPVLCFDEEDSQIQYDDATQRLILIRHQEIAAIPLNPADSSVYMPASGKVESVRFSLNCRIAAIRRSEVEIEFVDLHLGRTFSHLHPKGSRGSRLLSFYWTGSAVCDLAIVTTCGIDFYLLQTETLSLKLTQSVSLSVAWSVYSHISRLVLLATGPQDNIMYGMQVHDKAVTQLPKFEVTLAPLPEQRGLQGNGQIAPRRLLLATDVTITQLYKMTFLIHVESARKQVSLRIALGIDSDPFDHFHNRLQVFLYQLFKDLVVRKFALSIFSTHASVSVTDNLLIVHAVDAKVGMLACDTYCDCSHTTGSARY